MNEHKYIIIIFGPTAAGKTDFALTLAQHMRSEIVNMDVGQFYEPLSIGTAKPDWRSMPVAHHLFDIVNQPQNITVVQYRDLVISTINDIWQRSNVPILVGGSGFYLKSLLFPPLLCQATDSSFSLNPEHSPEQLWHMLNEIDPTRAAKIHKNDVYRIKRALEIWHKTGKKPSEQQPAYDPVSPFILVHVTRERDDLYERINTRVHEMIKAGWPEEVAALEGTEWERFLKTKKIIGYDDLQAYLDGERTSDQLHNTINIIQQKTRNYAKRQEAFWSMLEKKLRSYNVDGSHLSSCQQILSFNLTLSGINLYIEQLLKITSGCFGDEG